VTAAPEPSAFALTAVCPLLLYAALRRRMSAAR
jgi:hypothetical protein